MPGTACGKVASPAGALQHPWGKLSHAKSPPLPGLQGDWEAMQLATIALQDPFLGAVRARETGENAAREPLFPKDLLFCGGLLSVCNL